MMILNDHYHLMLLIIIDSFKEEVRVHDLRAANIPSHGHISLQTYVICLGDDVEMQDILYKHS